MEEKKLLENEALENADGGSVVGIVNGVRLVLPGELAKNAEASPAQGGWGRSSAADRVDALVMIANQPNPDGTYGM